MLYCSRLAATPLSEMDITITTSCCATMQHPSLSEIHLSIYKINITSLGVYIYIFEMRKGLLFLYFEWLCYPHNLAPIFLTHERTPAPPTCHHTLSTSTTHVHSLCSLSHGNIFMQTTLLSSWYSLLCCTSACSCLTPALLLALHLCLLSCLYPALLSTFPPSHLPSHLAFCPPSLPLLPPLGSLRTLLRACPRPSMDLSVGVVVAIGVAVCGVSVLCVCVCVGSLPRETHRPTTKAVGQSLFIHTQNKTRRISKWRRRRWRWP